MPGSKCPQHTGTWVPCSGPPAGPKGARPCTGHFVWVWKFETARNKRGRSGGHRGLSGHCRGKSGTGPARVTLFSSLLTSVGKGATNIGLGVHASTSQSEYIPKADSLQARRGQEVPESYRKDQRLVGRLGAAPLNTKLTFWTWRGTLSGSKHSETAEMGYSSPCT